MRPGVLTWAETRRWLRSIGLVDLPPLPRKPGRQVRVTRADGIVFAITLDPAGGYRIELIGPAA